MSDVPSDLPSDVPSDLPSNSELSPELDPALATAVLEIETYVAQDGWDGPGRLFALVDTAQLVQREPALASMLGLDRPSEDGSLTPIEQDPLAGQLEEALETVAWPEGVAGCAAVVERLVLPPDAHVPDEAGQAVEFAAQHPDRQEVRIVAGVTREGSSYCALRLRAHDEQASVVGGVDLVPGLIALLKATLEETDE